MFMPSTHWNAGERPFATSSECWGSVSGSFAGLPGNTAPPSDTGLSRPHRPTLMPHCVLGCAITLAIIRAGRSGRLITTPAAKAGR